MPTGGCGTWVATAENWEWSNEVPVAGTLARWPHRQTRRFPIRHETNDSALRPLQTCNSCSYLCLLLIKRNRVILPMRNSLPVHARVVFSQSPSASIPTSAGALCATPHVLISLSPQRYAYSLPPWRHSRSMMNASRKSTRTHWQHRSLLKLLPKFYRHI